MLNRLGGKSHVNFFDNYDALLIAFVGAPPGDLPPDEQWGASQPDVSGLRMFAVKVTAKYASDTSVTLQLKYATAILDAKPKNTTTAHELGHIIGFSDLYPQTQYRDDLLYMGDWALMNWHSKFPHFCGYNKMVAGWIKPERIVNVGLPSPMGSTSTEALLVPVEYWDDGMEAAVKALYGGSLPVAQLIKINLGGDGVQFDLVEARQKGLQFSQGLPHQPAVLLSNAIDYNDDTAHLQFSIAPRAISVAFCASVKPFTRVMFMPS